MSFVAFFCVRRRGHNTGVFFRRSVFHTQGLAQQKKQLRIVVHFLVVLHLLGRKVGKIIAGQTADEKCAMDNVIVTQHTVQRQVFCNTVVVADNADTVPPRIHDLDGAADNCLLGFKGVFNVGFAGVLSGFNDQHFHRYSPHQKFLSAHFFA